MKQNDFRLEHLDFCNRFNETLDLFYRCGQFVSKKETSKEDIEKYNEYLIKYQHRLGEMIQEYKRLTGEKMPDKESLEGFIIYTPNKVKPGEKFIKLEVQEG